MMGAAAPSIAGTAAGNDSRHALPDDTEYFQKAGVQMGPGRNFRGRTGS